MKTLITEYEIIEMPAYSGGVLYSLRYRRDDDRNWYYDEFDTKDLMELDRRFNSNFEVVKEQDND